MQRLTDVAIVLRGRGGERRAVSGVGGRRRAVRGQHQRVMVPAEQDRLEEDRGDSDQRRPAPP